MSAAAALVRQLGPRVCGSAPLHVDERETRICAHVAAMGDADVNAYWAAIPLYDRRVMVASWLFEDDAYRNGREVTV